MSLPPEVSLLLTSLDPTRPTRIPQPFTLGPLDTLTNPAVPIFLVYIYRNPHPPTPVVLRDRLIWAVQRFLDYYPQLTGRLGNTSDGAVLDRLGSGALLVDAVRDTPLPAGRVPLLPHLEGNDLLPPMPSTADEAMTTPVLAIKRTEFSCGSVTLGIYLNHQVTDMAGFCMLVNHLAEIYTKHTLDHPPLITPFMSSPMTEEERSMALTFTPSLFRLDNTVTDLKTEWAGDGAKVEGRHFMVSDEVGSLKPPDISTYAFLCAVVHRGVYTTRKELRTRLSPPDFLSSFNARPRFGLPPQQFGNMAFVVSRVFPEDLLEGKVEDIASAIHDIHRSPDTMDEGRLSSTLRWIQAQPDKARVKTYFEFGNGSMMVTQWSSFDFYAAVFDGIQPEAVEEPFNRLNLVDGLMRALRTLDGSLYISLSLAEDLWDGVTGDETFQRCATSHSSL